jgi:hypothetical protein
VSFFHAFQGGVVWCGELDGRADCVFFS